MMLCLVHIHGSGSKMKGLAASDEAQLASQAKGSGRLANGSGRLASGSGRLTSGSGRIARGSGRPAKVRKGS